MKKKDISQNHDMHQKEEYQFIKEQIRPRKHKKLKRICERFMLTFFMALIFGTVSGLTFYIANEVMEKTKPIEQADSKSVSTEEGSVVGNYSSNSFPYPQQAVGISNLPYESAIKKMTSIGKETNASIVTVSESKEDDWFQNKSDGKTIGSGILIKKDSDYYYFLLSSFQENSKKFTVTLQNHEMASATIVSREKDLGLAVVRVKLSAVSQNFQKELQVVPLQQNDEFELGEPVIAVGCPSGGIYSVLCGYITNDVRKVDITDGHFSLYGTNIAYADKEDGVMIDTQGKIIGVISNVFSKPDDRSNCSFLGMRDLYDTINKMLGEKNIPYLGIQGIDLADYSEGANDQKTGVSITKIYSDSPAYHAGLRVADIIDSMDGKPVTNMYDLRSELLTKNAGQKVNMKVFRMNGTEKKKITYYVEVR